MTGSNVEDVAVTKILATFVATSSPAQLSPELITKVKEVLIDYCGIVIGALPTASTKPIYTAITTLQGPLATGASTVIGHGPPHMLPQYASLINSALGHSLDFDDTYAPGSLHAGITSISAAMTCAELLGSTKAVVEQLMLAICVGYEVTCRLGRELGMESYRRGFHNTSTAGIFGAVAAISVLKGLPAEVIEMAFVHDAFMCVALAEAGVVGATRSIEGKTGFLQAYSPRENKDMQRLVNELGKEWVWLESSLKPFPACRMTHGFIEIADEMRKKRSMAVSEEEIQKIVVTMPPVKLLLIGDPTPNKIHPQNQIDAQFSVYFQVAAALLYGSGMGVRVYDMLDDPKIVAICDRITVKMDPTLEVFAAVLRVEWADGTVDEARQDFSLGEVQHPFTRERIDEKFMTLVAPVFGEDRSRGIIRLIDGLESHSVVELFRMLQ